MNTNDYELVLETKYQKGYWQAQQKNFFSIWQTPIMMPLQTYEREIVRFFETIKKNAPQFILMNAQQAKYIVDPPTQHWINENYAPIYIEIHLQKMAMIVSEDLFAQVSFEQALDDIDSKAFSVQYFKNEEEALQWIQN